MKLLFLFVFFGAQSLITVAYYPHDYDYDGDDFEDPEETDNDWNYKDQRHWCHISEFCCGANQSPIKLYETDEHVKYPPFRFEGYSELPTSVEIENEGPTVVVTFHGLTPKISGGGLRGTYTFASLHFHWGVDNYQGSEHIINRRQAPMELHIIHHKSKFSNVTEAVASKERDALAVLGVLYWIDDRQTNPSLEKIASSLSKIQFKHEETEVKLFSLRKLLPQSTEWFFRYWGSLTTPTCNEVVVWTVFQGPGFINPTQMKAFRSTYSTEKDVTNRQTIANNYRQTQSLNRRVVYQGRENYYN